MSYIKSNYIDGHAIKLYSQEGEDAILARIFEKQQTGFYVDVGAHHPKRFSNTYYFYKKNWKGINIDPLPGSMKRFNKYRPYDINLEIGVSSSKGYLNYYMFNEPALNTFDGKIAHKRDGENGYFIKKVIEIETFTLEEILDKYLLPNQVIDFLSIDTEGYDFYILKSNNFNKYRPKVILIEVLGVNLDDLINHDITLFLKNNDYYLFAKCFNTVLFITRKYFEDSFKRRKA